MRTHIRSCSTLIIDVAHIKHTKLRNHILIKTSWIHHLQLIDEYPHIHHNWSVMIVMIYKTCTRKR